MNPFDHAVDRRTFLKATGLAAAGVTIVPALELARSATARAQSDVSTITNIPDLAFALGYDPNEMFRYVADQIGYDTYAGALRGPIGTLWSSAGNAVDQALLLAALLHEAVIPYRFVIGTLDASTGATLMAPSTVTDARERIASRILPPDVSRAWTGTGSWQRPASIDPLFETARAQTQATVELITQALSNAGVTVGTPAPSIPDLELQQHVWVQYANGADWIDVDPSIPNAVAASAYGTNGTTMSAIPDELYHTVTFTVTADVIQSAALTSQTLLTQTLRSADVTETPITLMHLPTDYLGLEAALAGATRYAPLLLVGPTGYNGTPMQFRVGGGVGGAFGGEGSTDGETVAEYLHVDVATPAGTARSAVRTVFDRLTPDERASGTYDLTQLPDVELVNFGKLGEVYLPISSVTMIAVTGSSTAYSFIGTDGTLPDDDAMKGSILAHLQPALRDLLLLDGLSDQTAPRYYPDEPTVTAFASAPLAIGSDGRSTIATRVDIIQSHLAWQPLTDAASPVPAGILAGAVDHAAERMLIEGAISTTPDKSADFTAVSVGGVFELAAQQKIGTVVLKPGDSVSLENVPPDALGRLKDALASGLVAVAPASPVQIGGVPRTGWWLIDPQTGLTRDQMDDGRGEIEEDAFLLIYERLHEWFVIGMCLDAVFAIGFAIGSQSMGLGILGAGGALGFCTLAAA